MREKQLPVEDAVRITTEAASALDYAHRHGVVHRDIKPENILLSDGQALVADFGVARAIDHGHEGSLTETGLTVGTPTYMSPEQASAGPVDARSDQYSLACVLYEMLTGEPPFTGSTPQALIAKRLAGPIPSVRTVRETVPRSIDLALTQALAKVPADRFPTIALFARALNQAPTTEAVAVAPSTMSVKRSASRRLLAKSALGGPRPGGAARAKRRHGAVLAFSGGAAGARGRPASRRPLRRVAA